jgi:hypothetical protein
MGQDGTLKREGGPIVPDDGSAAGPVRAIELPALPKTEVPPNGEPTAPAASSRNDDRPKRRAAKRRSAGPARARIAANDDVPSIGGLIYALEQRPSNRPFLLATGASALWLVLGAVFAWMALAPELSALPAARDIFGRPIFMTVAATIFVPVLVFWFLALLVWRAQELKLMSSAMTEVAVRLAEPDRHAEQAIASLGQVVRKQVGHMNEAVSRALGRAGELEALVHNEVSNLERAYGENEHRIRSLLKELSGEREALVATSDSVAGNLKSMGTEIPRLIEKLSEQQIKLAKIIEGAGQNLIALESSLATATSGLESGLGQRTVHLQTVLDEYTGALNNALGNRTLEMQSVFEQYTRALDTTLASRAQAIDVQLVERTKALDDAFGQRLALVDESILRSAMAIDETVGEKARALATAMEHHAQSLSSTLSQQATNLDETLMHGIHAVRRTSENITRQSVKALEGLNNQSDLLKTVSENLLQQISTVTNRVENQGQSIIRAANALESANFRIDATLQNRNRELADTLTRLSGKSEELDKMLHGYSSSIEGTIGAVETRTRSLAEELQRETERQSQEALRHIERVKVETDERAQRALADLRQTFGTVSDEVNSQLGQLTNRFSETSQELRTSAQRAASEFEAEQARIRSEAQRLPTATRESADAMRRVLEEQLRALEQLSSLSNRQLAERDVVPPAPPPRSIPPPQSLSDAYRGQVRPPAPPAATPIVSPTPANATSDRWSLGDLLARASLDEVQQATAASAPGGFGVNVETIARALDAQTAAAIWQRIRGGQRGVMVRSIYTAEGRSTFDEVSRRYRADAGFGETVNRFIADFEALLRDTEMRDPSGRAVMSHLMSESGRVYLFLGHAAGRIT